MKTLTAVVMAVSVLVLGVTASAACDGMKRDQTAAKSDGSVYYPPAENS